jgi:pimeloyl-ACP methyl ester carboxylesterase
VIDAAGEPVHVYGISSGGLLALEPAKRIPDKVARLALYEIPFVVDDSRPPVPDTFPAELESLLAAGRRGQAVKLFMRDAVRLPRPLVAAMPLFPGWSKNKAVAHTLTYDVAIMSGTQSGRPLPRDRWADVTTPTLVASGAKSPAWVRNAAEQLAAVLPNATRHTLERQTHYVKPDVLAPRLGEFLACTA